MIYCTRSKHANHYTTNAVQHGPATSLSPKDIIYITSVGVGIAVV